MANTPIVLSADTKKHEPLASGAALDPNAVPIIDSEDSILKRSPTGLYVNPSDIDAAKLISTSAGMDNLLTKNPTDGKLQVNRDDIEDVLGDMCLLGKDPCDIAYKSQDEIITGNWTFTKPLHGTADVATKLGTATVGGPGIPIYLNNGTPTPCTLQQLSSSLVESGGGLSIDSNGQIFVDFNSMPTDKFEKLLESLNLPIFLNSWKAFYVNGTTGSDTIVQGRGESMSLPFKTIQACVNWVTKRYNVNSVGATIYIAAGTYRENVVLPDFTRTSGSITLQNYDGEFSAIIVNPNQNVNCTTVNAIAGVWNIIGLKIICNGTGSSSEGIFRLFCCVSAGYGATLNLYSYSLENQFIGSAPTTLTELRTVWATQGTVRFGVHNGSKYIYCNKGNSHSATVLFSDSDGRIDLHSSNTAQSNADVYCNGNYNQFALVSQANISRFATYPATIRFLAQSGGSCVGTRYTCTNGGTMSIGAGPNYFPGTIAGWADASTYSYYI